VFIYGGRRGGGDRAFDAARSVPVQSGAVVPAGATALGGYFDGFPNDLHAFGLDNANHGRNLISVDIIFNTNAASRLAVIPAPSSLALLTAGLLGLAAFTRRRRSH
jgi:hypothetical protein